MIHFEMDKNPELEPSRITATPATLNESTLKPSSSTLETTPTYADPTTRQIYGCRSRPPGRDLPKVTRAAASATMASRHPVGPKASTALAPEGYEAIAHAGRS